MNPIEGEPAFPNGPSGMSIHFDDGHVEHQYPGSPGMSERRYYIGQALAGICANPNRSHWKANGAAKEAIKTADAVMQLLYPQPKETEQ